MEQVLPFAITYDVEDQLPLSDVAESLIAIERVTREIAPFLSDIISGFEVSAAKIGIKEITQASPLKEIFFISLFFTYQKELETEVPAIIEKLTGLSIADSHDSLITVTILMLLFYGAEYVFNKVNPDKKAIEIKKVLNELQSDLAIELGITEDEVAKVLEEKYGSQKKRSLGKMAVGFFSPAKKSVNGRIKAGSRVISRDVIREIPSDDEIEEHDPPQKTTSYQNVEIEIHAQDQDSSKSGWAGIIKKISDKRIKMEIFPPLTPEDIYTKSVIIGDIILVSKLKENGKYIPTHFHLIRLNE